MAALQSDYHPVIQDFISWVRKNQITEASANPESKRSFIPYPALDDYFGRPGRMRKLLEVVLPDKDISFLKYKGRFIHWFVCHSNLSDRHLPFEVCPPHFPVDTSDPNFFESFYQHQWQFCAPEITYNEDLRFEAKEWILPIIEKEEIGGGGSAIIYRIILHEAYNKLHPRGRDRSEPRGPYANTFVLKTYRTHDAEKHWNNEVGAFRNFQNSGQPDEDIIGFHGSFIRYGTYNVLLEYADKGTLDHYFETTSPPFRREDIFSFWKGLCRILRALLVIHGIPHDEEAPRVLRGWHQDVKPANILVFSGKSGSPYDVQCRLADLGSSHFKNSAISLEQITDRDTHGTRTYGAPECYRDSSVKDSSFLVEQKVDIWSFGCILSEAAVWVVLGMDSLREYRRRRIWETNQIPDFHDGDCFHDGDKILKVVLQMLEDLPQSIRTSDYITEKLLSMIEKEMLTIPEKRSTAQKLWYKSKDLMWEAEENMERTRSSQTNRGTQHLRNDSLDSHQRPRVLPAVIPSDCSAEPHALSSSQIQQTSNDNSSEQHLAVTERSSILPPHSQEQIRWDQYLDRESPLADISKLNQEPMSIESGSGRAVKGKFSHIPNNYSSSSHFRLDNDGDAIPAVDQFFNPRTRYTSSDQDHLGGPSSMPGPSSIPSPRNQTLDDDSFDDSIDKNLRDTRGRFTQGPLDVRRKGKQSSLQDMIVTSPQSPNSNGISSSEPDRGQEIKQNNPPNLIIHSSGRSTLTASTFAHPNNVTPAYRGRKPSFPYLSVDEGCQWRERRRQGKDALLPNLDFLTQQLKRRDHVFLIDNCRSMRHHWGEVQNILDLLAYIVKNSDPDGMELYFTNSKDKFKSKKSSSFLQVLKEKEATGESNMCQRMRAILHDYEIKSGCQQSSRMPKGLRRWWKADLYRPLNLYIFTDGLWPDTSDPASNIISSMVDHLNNNDLVKEQVGIQFICFGDDPNGLQRLQHLDSQLDLEKDIVDTESASGNVWKMLRGSIDPVWDNDESTSKEDTL